MEKVLNLYKELGETPLACLERFRKNHPEYQALKMTYAGRLDPLAEGVLIVLVDDEITARESYFTLPKEYSVEILIGISSDSYDVLGIPTLAPHIPDVSILKEQVVAAVDAWKVLTEQTYPPYSSKTVDGVQLHAWARSGRIAEIEIPTREIVITDARVMGFGSISAAALKKKVLERITLVKGDFRQNEISAAWSDLFLANPLISFPVISVDVVCGGGVYMRTLAHELGKTLGCGALALSIRRNRVGEHAIRDSL